jgi:LysR family transcriptional regulator, low CO2-responsive transcriptional regulator
MSRREAVTMKQLRALAGVAETGSITAAAALLNLTPPAVHSQIKGLEEATGVSLVTRASDAAGSALTPAGREMLLAAHRIEATLSQALIRVAALGQGLEGRVTLGVVSTAKYFAPGLVKTLRMLHPGIEVVLRVGNREEILRDLSYQTLDLVVMGRPPREPLVLASAIGEHPHGLIAPADHRLAGKAALQGADLLGETFIAREEGSGTRALMRRYLDQLGEGTAFAEVEMNSNESIKQSVMAGLGIAVISLHTVVAELKRGDLVLLAGPRLPIMRQWFLVDPTRGGLTPAARRIHDAILALKGSFLPDVPGQ